MSKIRCANTEPEVAVRKGLFARGYRYRLHQKALPGRPDIVLPKYRVVIFVNGCFWHQHWCQRAKIPASREAFWTKKLLGNIERDRKVRAALQEDHWRVLVVWECALRGRGAIPFSAVLDEIETFIRGSGQAVDEMPSLSLRTRVEQW